MRLTVINCSPRPAANSNTEKILDRFLLGFADETHTVERFRLSERGTWPTIREAYRQGDFFLFAMPLFVECVPGLLLEFLESLSPKEQKADGSKATMAFLVQGGFSEASQLRCCETYLEKLPAYFNCEHAGTLIKGDMFAVSIFSGKMREQMIGRFEDAGRRFRELERFDKDEVTEFAKPEYFSEKDIKGFNRMHWLQKLMIEGMARKLGAKTKLNAKPYAQYVKD
ncbi:MAG: NAD(P)H-dependent oxidoreductase [Eubacteriales bacterium]|nr:NAD(P)H-dependent oxidoreductase [Eubacteriales bacterium]